MEECSFYDLLPKGKIMRNLTDVVTSLYRIVKRVTVAVLHFSNSVENNKACPEKTDELCQVHELFGCPQPSFLYVYNQLSRLYMWR